MNIQKFHLSTFRLLFILLLLQLPYQVFGNSISKDTSDTREDYSNLIENIHIKTQLEGLNVHWNIAYDSLQELAKRGYQISIRYNTELEAERFEKGYSDKGWKQIEHINLKSTEYTIHNLIGDEYYKVQVGISGERQTYWSESHEGKTKGTWSIFNFLVLLGSLALFLYGMKIMSDGLQHAAGKKLRNLLGSMTSNRFKGMLTGLGITTLIQSSSVTTVMTVSFVNAGILSLMQAAGVIMGANIGTTATAWLIDIFGFKVDIGSYALILMAVGVPFFFIGSNKIRGWASAIIGFSLLFLGLGFLKKAVPEVSPDSTIVHFFVSLNNIPYISSVVCVLFGTLLTVIIQSSSATVALTMTLMTSGIIPFEVGAAMVLGENIGTTITAELAATVGNVYAKRAARIHSSFNIFGVVWALLCFPLLLKAVAYLTTLIDGGNPISDPIHHGSTGLAVLHTLFNLLNTGIMIWLIPQLVKFAEKTVRIKEDKDTHFQLEYIGEGHLIAPELSILEVKTQLSKFAKLTGNMSHFTSQLLFEKDKKVWKDLFQRIKKYEEITDNIEKEIAAFLNKVTSNHVDSHLAARINGMNRIASNLERIGDIFFQISKIVEKKNEEKINFSDTQNDNLKIMFDLVEQAFQVMTNNLAMHVEDVTLTQATEIENRINDTRNRLRREYYDQITTSNPETIEAGLLYNSTFSLLERIGDHIMNVSEGILGKL